MRVQRFQYLCSEFFGQVLDHCTKDIYGYRRSNPHAPILPFDGFPEGLRECNGRVCVVLLQASPETVKVRSLQHVGLSAQMHTVRVLDALLDYVAPGGHEEQEGLMQFIRSPGCAGHVEPAGAILLTWAHSQTSPQFVVIPKLSALEK